MPLATLISAEYAAERREADPLRPGVAGDAAARRDSAAARSGFGGLRESRPDPFPEPDTSYVCVADRWGNLFSATPSDGSYGSPVVPGTGLIPSNRGSQSRPDPRHPVRRRARQAAAPDAQPGAGDQGPATASCRSARRAATCRRQAMLQVLLNVFVFDQDLQAAIESPRFASYSFPSSFAPFDYYPGRLGIEGRIPEGVIAELARRGHKIERWPEWIWTRRRGLRDRSTKGAASWKPAPTHAAPPMRSGSSLAATDATAERGS